VLAVFIVTLCIFVAVVWVLLWVKTPHYLMQKDDLIQLLEKVLVGQASENEWAIFLSSSFRHAPDLEAVRDTCAAIDEKEYIGNSRTGFLFSERGLSLIKQVLEDLR
jgi:hypothetical protein